MVVAAVAGGVAGGFGETPGDRLMPGRVVAVLVETTEGTALAAAALDATAAALDATAAALGSTTPRRRV